MVMRKIKITLASDDGVATAACSELLDRHAAIEVVASLDDLTGSNTISNAGVFQKSAGAGTSIVEPDFTNSGTISADAATLAGKLIERETGEKLVLTDGVFSMDGDVAPVTQLAAACRRHDAWFMVDDAHGLGVLDQANALGRVVRGDGAGLSVAGVRDARGVDAAVEGAGGRLLEGLALLDLSPEGLDDADAAEDLAHGVRQVGAVEERVPLRLFLGREGLRQVSTARSRQEKEEH